MLRGCHEWLADVWALAVDKAQALVQGPGTAKGARADDRGSCHCWMLCMALWSGALLVSEAKVLQDLCCVGDVGLQVACRISVHGQRHCLATDQLPVDFTGHYKLQLGSQTGPLVPGS